MKSIFSTQNLQTFFLRKYWRLPRRGPPGPPPGPPGPPSRRPPPPGPPSRRGPEWECPPSRRGGAPPSERCAGAAGADAAGAWPPSAAGGAGGGAACVGFCSSDITSYLSNVAPAVCGGALQFTDSIQHSCRAKARRLQKAPASEGGRYKTVARLRAGGLFRRRSWRSDAARTARGALLALVRKLFLTLELFVEADGLILDDHVLDAKTALEFVDQFAVVGADLVVDVDAFAVFGHLVGE